MWRLFWKEKTKVRLCRKAWKIYKRRARCKWENTGNQSPDSIFRRTRKTCIKITIKRWQMSSMWFYWHNKIKSIFPRRTHQRWNYQTTARHQIKRTRKKSKRWGKNWIYKWVRQNKRCRNNTGYTQNQNRRTIASNSKWYRG